MCRKDASLKYCTAYDTDVRMYSAILRAGMWDTIRVWIVEPVHEECTYEEAQLFMDDTANTSLIMRSILNVFRNMDCTRYQSVQLLLQYISQCPQAHEWPVLSLLLQVVFEFDVKASKHKIWQFAILDVIQNYSAWNHLSCTPQDLQDLSPTLSPPNVKYAPIVYAAYSRFAILVTHLMCKVREHDLYAPSYASFQFPQLVAVILETVVYHHKNSNTMNHLDTDAIIRFVFDHWITFTSTNGWRVNAPWTPLYAPITDYQHELRYILLASPLHSWDTFIWMVDVTKRQYGRIAVLDFFIPQYATLYSMYGRRAHPICEVTDMHVLVPLTSWLLAANFPAQLLFEPSAHLGAPDSSRKTPIEWCNWSYIEVLDMSTGELHSSVLADVLAKSSHSEFDHMDLMTFYKNLMNSVFIMLLCAVRYRTDISLTMNTDTVDIVVQMLFTHTSRSRFSEIIFWNIPEAIVRLASPKTREGAVAIVRAHTSTDKTIPHFWTVPIQ